MRLTEEEIYERISHPYFRETEPRYEKGSGLQLALDEMETRRQKSEALRAARQAATRQGDGLQP